MATDKLERLRSLIRSFGSCAIAYSGGVDSVFLAVIAHQELGENSVAVIADSPSLPRHELAEAKSIASTFNFRLHILLTEEFHNDDYVSNPVNRCYFCKAELFQRLAPFATEHKLAVIAYGENSSDLGDVRPGRKAADEFAIRAPLREVALSKEEIRAISRSMGLPTADKPAMPCLSSRIPYGEIVSPEKLALVEAAEQLIRNEGFPEVRVRLHELKQGFLARIELAANDLARFFADSIYDSLVTPLSELGFTHVTVDLRAYRRGSLNQTVTQKATAEKSGDVSARSVLSD